MPKKLIEYKISVAWEYLEQRYTVEKYISTTRYSLAAKRVLEYLEKTCPGDFNDVTQIAMRVKRKQI